MHHPAGIDDAQIPVQFGQHPIAARPGAVHTLDVFPVSDQAKLHKSASAGFRSSPDGPGGIVKFKGKMVIRIGESRKAVPVVRAFIERAPDGVVSFHVFLRESQADGVLKSRAAAPGDGLI